MEVMVEVGIRGREGERDREKCRNRIEMGLWNRDWIKQEDNQMWRGGLGSEGASRG